MRRLYELQVGQNTAGPHLDGIMGGKAGSVEGARYSRALQGSQIVWGEQTISNFLANPRKAVPGTTMMITDLPATADTRSGKDFVVLAQAATS